MRTSKNSVLLVVIITFSVIALLVLAIGPIQKWMSELSIFWGFIISMVTFVVTGIWAWIRKKEYIFHGSIDAKPWRDLRIWAAILMLAMIIAYLIF